MIKFFQEHMVCLGDIMIGNGTFLSSFYHIKMGIGGAAEHERARV